MKTNPGPPANRNSIPLSVFPNLQHQQHQQHLQHQRFLQSPHPQINPNSLNNTNPNQQNNPNSQNNSHPQPNSHPNQQSNPNSNPLINPNYPNPTVSPHPHANPQPAPTWAGRDSMGNIFILPRQLEVGLCQNCKRLFGVNSHNTLVSFNGQTCRDSGNNCLF